MGKILKLPDPEGIKNAMVLETKKKDVEFRIDYDEKTSRFYYTIVGGTPAQQKKLLRRAYKKLSYETCFTDSSISILDIYDVTSLTSAESLFELCAKIKLVLEGC